MDIPRNTYPPLHPCPLSFYVFSLLLSTFFFILFVLRLPVLYLNEVIKNRVKIVSLELPIVNVQLMGIY